MDGAGTREKAQRETEPQERGMVEERIQASMCGTTSQLEPAGFPDEERRSSPYIITRRDRKQDNQSASAGIRMRIANANINDAPLFLSGSTRDIKLPLLQPLPHLRDKVVQSTKEDQVLLKELRKGEKGAYSIPA